MTKPKTISGYSDVVTANCERVLVTLMRRFGPWKACVFLVGGLVPRYLVAGRPPAVPPHAGTGDVDVVVDLSILADTEAYSTLEENLKSMGFSRGSNSRGDKVNWRWMAEVEKGVTVILEFLADDPERAGGRVQELPTDGNVSALNIPHSSMVFDLHERRQVTTDLLDDDGRATEEIAFADIVSFTCLKAFAIEHRNEGKDAHDLVFCLEHGEDGVMGAVQRFRAAMESQHRDVISSALGILRRRFCADSTTAGYLRDGCVSVAKFELGDDQELREARLLRQRRVSELVTRLLDGVESSTAK